MLPVYSPSRPIPSPLSRITRGGFGAAYTPPPPFTTAQHMSICLSVVDPRPFFGPTSQRPRPRGPKGAHLKEETKRNRFPLYSSLIRVLGAEQSAPKDRRKFSEKRAKMHAPTFHLGRRHFGMFWTGRASTSSRASTAGMAPI